MDLMDTSLGSQGVTLRAWCVCAGAGQGWRHSLADGQAAGIGNDRGDLEQLAGAQRGQAGGRCRAAC